MHNGNKSTVNSNKIQISTNQVPTIFLATRDGVRGQGGDSSGIQIFLDWYFIHKDTVFKS